MNKLGRITLLSLFALLLTSCGSGSEMNLAQAKTYANEHFSMSEALDKYQSVTYTRTVDVVLERAKEVEGDDAATAKNAAILANLESYYGSTSGTNTVVLSASTISEFFMDEAFLNQFDDVYSIPKVPAVYSLNKKGMEAHGTYSRPYTEDELQAQDVKEGGMAVESVVISNAEGCIITTDGSVSVAMNVDGDDEGTADVEYTMIFKASFVWNLK